MFLESILKRTGFLKLGLFQAMGGMIMVQISVHFPKQVVGVQINGTYGKDSGGNPRVILSADDLFKLPKGITELAEGYEYHETFPRERELMLGIYRSPSARAKLITVHLKNDKPMYHLRSNAKCLNDILVLVKLIKTDAIRPASWDENYEEPPEVPSYLDLRARLDGIEAEFAAKFGLLDSEKESLLSEKIKLEKDLNTTCEQKGKMETKIYTLTRFAFDLKKGWFGWWPFCRKKKVISKMTAVLLGKEVSEVGK